jgi:hypothetical protein
MNEEMTPEFSELLRTIQVLEISRDGGLRSAVDAMCCYCIFEPSEQEPWQYQVACCDNSQCPLHNHRPRSFIMKM